MQLKQNQLRDRWYRIGEKTITVKADDNKNALNEFNRVTSERDDVQSELDKLKEELDSFKEKEEGFDLREYILDVNLTDATDDGGLFGIRFD